MTNGMERLGRLSLSFHPFPLCLLGVAAPSDRENPKSLFRSRAEESRCNSSGPSLTVPKMVHCIRTHGQGDKGTRGHPVLVPFSKSCTLA